MIDLAVSSFNRREREREFDEIQKKKKKAIVKSNESGN